MTIFGIYISNKLLGPILSGIIAALFSGVFSIYTTHVQKKNNENAIASQAANNEKIIDNQTDIMKQQEKDKLIYQTQLNWGDKLRELTANLYADWSRLQDSFNESQINLNNGDNSNAKERAKDSQKSIYKIQYDIILIELYLSPYISENHKCFRSLLKVLELINEVKPGKEIPKATDTEILHFIRSLRAYFKEQMDEMTPDNPQNINGLLKPVESDPPY